ncbi:MAG: peptide ABC transporter substrate-binding protein [Dehalococcoidia bacterium]
MRRLVLVLTGIAVVLVIVIGGVAVALNTGGDGDGEGSDTGEALPPREAGELRLFGPDPLTLDPACANDASSARYIVEVFSGLLTFDQDQNIVSDIAKSIPEPDSNADGSVTYTFELRRGVLFHDRSRQVTARDFKFSMERALSPDTLSSIALVYLGDIVGAEEFADGEAEAVTGIEAVGDFTLEITIDAPKPYFLAKLTYPTAFVVDRNEVGDSSCFQGTEWTLSPNGTGPFKLEEWRLGERVILLGNEQYEPQPSLAKVTYLLAGGSQLTMYENDEVDIAFVGLNDIERIRDPSDPLNPEFREAPSLDTAYVGFNVTKPPFDDVKVRQAFAMAVDKDKLVKVVLRELAVPANGILPPDMPGFNPGLEGLPFDPEGAKELLAQSKYGDNRPEITLTSSGQGATVGPVLDNILFQWEENLGVTVNADQEQFGLFLQDLDAGRFQMFDLGWVADYIDPQNFLEIKFYSENIGSTNETRYSNSEVDELLEKAQTEENQKERFALYRRAEEIIVEDAAWIPLFHGKNSYLVKPYVQGFEEPPLVIPRLRYVSLSQR